MSFYNSDAAWIPIASRGTPRRAVQNSLLLRKIITRRDESAIHFSNKGWPDANRGNLLGARDDSSPSIAMADYTCSIMLSSRRTGNPGILAVVVLANFTPVFPSWFGGTLARSRGKINRSSVGGALLRATSLNRSCVRRTRWKRLIGPQVCCFAVVATMFTSTCVAYCPVLIHQFSMYTYNSLVILQFRYIVLFIIIRQMRSPSIYASYIINLTVISEVIKYLYVFTDASTLLLLWGMNGFV